VKPLAESAIPPTPTALLWLERSHDTEQELRRVWAEKIVRPACRLMLELLNMGDAPSDVQRFRKRVPPLTDIAREDDERLVALRDELRGLWKELEKERAWFGPTGEFGNNEAAAIVFHRLWHHYELESPGYMIFWTTGSFFPTQQNFRGIIARILFDKRRYLALCRHCNGYFIKKRDDQQICLGLNCSRKANRQRQSRHQAKKRQIGRKNKGRS